MKVLFLNIYEGCKDQDRLERIISFVRQEHPDVLGLSELNGWDADDFSMVKHFQQKTGFPHVAFCESHRGYHLGLFSRIPSVKQFATNEGFDHGMVKVEIASGNSRVSYILTHLNPLNEDLRLMEIERILHYVSPEEKVIMMGDFNSLSFQDQYGQDVLLKMRQLGITKFGQDRLRYDVTKRIADAGFIDAVRACSSAFEYSVQTPLNVDQFHFAQLRLDYIFAKNLSSELKYAKIIRNHITDQLSDHYPVIAEFDL